MCCNSVDITTFVSLYACKVSTRMLGSIIALSITHYTQIKQRGQELRLKRGQLRL